MGWSPCGFPICKQPHMCIFSGGRPYLLPVDTPPVVSYVAATHSFTIPPSLMSSATAVRVVDVYPYREGAVNPEFLLLRRAAGTEYEGQWRMVGGKIEDGEAAWEAGLRECREETGQSPTRFWALPSVNTFYEWRTDRVNLAPAFAAALPAEPTLDDEHADYGWWPAREAAERLAWPEQRRLVRLADRTLRRGVPPSLVVEGIGR